MGYPLQKRFHAHALDVEHVLEGGLEVRRRGGEQSVAKNDHAAVLFHGTGHRVAQAKRSGAHFAWYNGNVANEPLPGAPFVTFSPNGTVVVIAIQRYDCAEPWMTVKHHIGVNFFIYTAVGGEFAGSGNPRGAAAIKRDRIDAALHFIER